MIKINGVVLPTPTSYKIPQFDLDSDDTTRDETGGLHRNRVRQGIFKIELEWKAIRSIDADKILNAIEPSSFNVEFPTTSGVKTKKMYAGDRNVTIARYYIKKDIRWDVSFNLIEF